MSNDAPPAYRLSTLRLAGKVGGRRAFATFVSNDGSAPDVEMELIIRGVGVEFTATEFTTANIAFVVDKVEIDTPVRVDRGPVVAL